MCLWQRTLSLCGLTVLLGVSFSLGADLASANHALKRKDYATAFKELAPLAKQGNPEAEFLLGRMYLMGQGVLKDPDEAYRLFRAAAAQGNADSEFFIGSKAVLQHKNLASGVRYLRLSAEQGNQDAQLLLGRVYMDGNDGLPRDPVKADMWLRLAAKNNLPFYKLQLETAERQMNAAQIARGKELAAAWKPQHGLKPGDKPKPETHPQSAAHPASK